MKLPYLIEALKTRPAFQKWKNYGGDREGHLEALQGREWDAVIDTSGHLPRIVESSSKLLANWTKHYTFILERRKTRPFRAVM